MTPTELCNVALGHIGQARIADIGERSPAAEHCRRMFEHVRRLCLRDHDWNFAIRRAALTALDSPPPFGFSAAFQLPADCLRVLEINGQPAGVRGTTWEVEGRTVLLNHDSAHLRYIADAEDTSQWDSIFASYFAYRLAAAVAPSLRLDPQAGLQLEQMAAAVRSSAQEADNVETAPRVTRLDQSEIIQERGGWARGTTGGIGAPSPTTSVSWGSVAVSGQSTVTATISGDTLTLVAGTNVTITTNPTTKAVTISATGGGGGGGATNLTATVSPTGVTIVSSTGTDAAIPAADGTNAGVMLPAQVTKLTGVATGATANATDAQLRDRSTHTGTQAISTIVNLQTSLDGKADLVGGKLNTSQLPDLAISQYLGTAANQSAMLLLVGQRGDWCARTDDGKVYIVTGEPSSTLGNWTSLSYPTAPVLSVAGRTGSVTLASGDISGLGALATLSSVGTDQITDGAVTQVKLWSGFVNGTKALPAWSARDNDPPATAFATIDTRNGQRMLDFDDAVTERAVFNGIIPAEFSLTGGFKVRVHWWASSINTAHRVKWCAEVERRNTAGSADSWGFLHSALGIPNGTQFVPVVTEITVTSIDGLVAGEPFRVRITRDAADTVNDTMIGDAELLQVQVIGN